VSQKPLQIGRLRFEMLFGLGLRGGGAVASFLLVWLIARMHGASTVGMFQVALLTVTMLANVAVLGLDRLIVRETSIAFSEGHPGRSATLFAQARVRLVLAGFITILFVLVVARTLADQVLNEPLVFWHIIILAPLPLGLAMVKLASGVLRAAGRVVVSQVLDGIGYTGIAATILGVAWLFGMGGDPVFPAVAYLAGVLVVSLSGLWLTSQQFRRVPREPAHLPVKPGIRIAAFSMLVAFGGWIGPVLLTATMGVAEAGIYRVAFQFCLFFTLVSSSFALMIGPHIATAAARGDKTGVLAAILSASRLGTVVSLPLLLVLLLFAEFALALFGEEFVEGAWALRILALGQFINVAFGPVGASLTMSGREKAVLWIELVVVVCSTGLTVLLLPLFGMEGLAVAILIAAVLRNGLSLFVLRRQLAGFSDTRREK
jgi:O-antigen/teichoic acid export membrane protein